jgi:TonB-dependent receptor
MGRRAFTLNGIGPTLLGSACLVSLPGVVQAQGEANQSASAVEEVTVTGYRRSLEDSATAKRESTNFTDSVFAEDIGKFPDLNIAESLNRIPGIQLTREITGEGLNIAIRGLGTNFTKVVLNGSQIAVASTGRTDSTNQNRELDLDLFPTELFNRLDVNKSPRASMIEGGVAGVVNMRSARPFDSPGTHFNYQLQGGYGEESGKYSPRGAVSASWTNDTFGVLLGGAAVRNKAETTGYETIGWTNPTITHGMCGTPPAPGSTQTLASVSPQCNSTGGNGWSQPGVTAVDGLGRVPRNVGNGLAEGTVIDRAFLEGQNPGVTLEQIGNALIPRLSRPSYSAGNRDRIAVLTSIEYRPSDRLSFYLDAFYAKADREFDRLDMNLVGRNGGIIPQNLVLDENNVVTSGRFVNSQFFLEARPYDEEVDFTNLNPGMHFTVNDWLGVDLQANKTRSKFFREAPSILVVTPLNQAITVDYTNEGGNFPDVQANVDLNDPNLGWSWGAGSRVNIQNERRDVYNEGARLDFKLGSDDLNVSVGAAYDEVERNIRALDASREWQQVVCGGGGPFIPAPAPAPGCNGQAGSVVTSGALASYLQPGPAGFVTVDFDRFFADTNYHALSESAPLAIGAATSARTGDVIEETFGYYAELNGSREIFGRMLRMNAGARHIRTDQTIAGPTNTALGAGPFVEDLKTYSKWLPSFNAAYNVTENIVARVAASRTLTRPDPSAMIPAVQFGDVGATNANVGNPELVSFISDNVDLGAEWYTGAEGFIGLSLFRKEIEGFTVNQTTTVPFPALGIPFESLTAQQQQALRDRGGGNPLVAPVNLQQQVNADGMLTIKGYEVIWVQPLGQWAQALEGFGYNLNYTRIQQEGEGAAPAQAIGVSPHAYNATLYFEKFDASVRLSYVWNDDQIASQFNEQGIPAAQRFTDAFGQWDLSASYEFTSLPTSPQVTLNVINITGETQRSTFQFPNATFTYYDPGYQILLGIRGKF